MLKQSPLDHTLFSFMLRSQIDQDLMDRNLPYGRWWWRWRWICNPAPYAGSVGGGCGGTVWYGSFTIPSGSSVLLMVVNGYGEGHDAGGTPIMFLLMRQFHSNPTMGTNNNHCSWWWRRWWRRC